MTDPARTPSYTELVACLRGEGEALLAAASQGLDVPVPTCEGWTVGDLVRHVSKVYCRTVQLVSERLTSPPEQRASLPEGERLPVFQELLDDLVHALSEAEPDTPVWNWADGHDDVAAFWARRMVHESSVHRFDAQLAHGVAQPIDAELAHDGMDELVDVIAPLIYGRDGVTGPVGTVTLDSSDDGTWHLELTEHGLTRLPVLSDPTATVHGTTSALLLAAYGRVPWSSQNASGETDLLEAWSESLNF